MSFFKIITAWSNAELALIKICLICFGISAGIYFYDSLRAYVTWFFIAFAITAAWALFLWLKKMQPSE